MEVLEQKDRWRKVFNDWRGSYGRDLVRGDIADDYPYVLNRHAAIKPLGRALPLLNLALITSAGAYLDGMDSFDLNTPEGDVSFREIPTEIEAGDLLYAARGYDPAAVHADMNAQIPLQRLFEFASNGIIGGVSPVFWSFCGFIPNAAKLADESLPRFVERVRRYEVNAALLIPASRLCHQSMALAARALEASGLPTMMLAVEREIVEGTRPPRCGYYNGEFGSVAGLPSFAEHQRRVLDEALRSMETIDQPTVRKLAVTLESAVELSRGEK